MPDSSPQSEPDVLPAFEVILGITIVAKDHDAAMEWAADQLVEITDGEDVLGSHAHVPREPVEFVDAD